MDNGKNKKIQFKLSEDLCNRFNNFCKESNITKSKFLRDSIKYFTQLDNSEKIFSKDEEFKRNLLYEFRRYGNNLNQIAYKLNLATKSNNLSADDSSLVKQALEDHKELNRKFRELRSLIAKRL